MSRQFPLPHAAGSAWPPDGGGCVAAEARPCPHRRWSCGLLRQTAAVHILFRTCSPCLDPVHPAQTLFTLLSVQCSPCTDPIQTVIRPFFGPCSDRVQTVIRPCSTLSGPPGVSRAGLTPKKPGRGGAQPGTRREYLLHRAAAAAASAGTGA